MTLPMIGRDAELSLLRRVVRAAAAGAGGVVLVEGPAGIGKTTLLDALVAELSEKGGAHVLRGRAWEEGGAPPYWPWREIAAAGDWPIPWSGYRDPFALFQDVAAAARASARQFDDALTVLVLDDLHAADDDTIHLTSFVARALRDAPIALVVAARPSDRLAALARLASTVVLGPLDRVSADLALDQYSTTSLGGADRAEIRRIAEGNPLVLRELARAGPTASHLPRELRVMVGQSFGALAADSRAVIEVAAVLGREFDVRRLAAAAGADVTAVLAAIDPARRIGIVTTVSPAMLTKWRFSHQIVRDLVYDEIPVSRRLELHARCADAISAEDRGGSSTFELARHLLSAVPVVDPARAVEAARLAATSARQAMSGREAAALLAQSLPLVEDPAERTQLLLELGHDQLDAGLVAAANRSFDEAIALARSATDAPLFADAVLGRTVLVGSDARVAEVLPLLDEALQLVTRVDGTSGSAWGVRLLARRAEVFANGADLATTARRAAERAVAGARALPTGLRDGELALAEALGVLHRCCWGPADLPRALEVGRELADVAGRIGDRDRLMDALLAAVIDNLRAGDLPRVDEALARYAAAVVSVGRPRHEFLLLSRQAARAFVAGRIAEGERLIEKARDLGSEIEEPDAWQVFHGARLFVVDQVCDQATITAQARGLEALASSADARFYVFIGHLYLAAGDRAGARRALSAAVAAEGRLTLDRFTLFELCLAAEVAAAVDLRETVSQLFDELMPYADTLVINAGAVTFGGVVEHYLGLLAGSLGRPDEARRRLGSALDRYEQLGTPLFVDRVRAAIDRLGSSPARTPPKSRSAVLRRHDNGWETGFVGNTFTIADARGLRHLASLVGSPDREIAAIDLVEPLSRGLVAGEARHALLDDDAKTAYRRRIRLLQDQLDEADRHGDVERNVHVQAELDFLLDELRRAVGLGGRDRVESTANERARMAVRKAIVATIDRLALHDPLFADHLRRNVRTGHLCAYVGDPNAPVEWLLS